ncbi:hypothetical protein BCR34DRAFT_582408 [Clohesyomyces aquaticus]|uniref:Uncharacterized protein n=1 Tax=Clohesyomyces aquaticus TaxID=1231657 RepID=A0A1Y2A9M2_9PLEO|nr:hypothetical protein BCR34DRAFT_582408 [Clohesyomyces aquaticus]
MKSTLITNLALAFSLAYASPVTHEKCRPVRTTHIAKYDDLPFVEPGPNPIPPHYYGLSYFTFQVDQYDGFIPPTSGNQWTMAFGGSGNISIPDSPPKQMFDLESFSFACDSGIPQPECAISIWGWKEGGKVIKRTINYPRLDPGHVIEDFKMNKTTFNWQWKDLKSIGFSIARADNGGDMYGGLALDDLKYTITEKQC